MTQLACNALPSVPPVSLNLLNLWTLPGQSPPHQMWPSRVWWSLPGLTQRGPAKTIVHDLAAQQVAGRSRMAGVFEETLKGPSLWG